MRCIPLKKFTFAILTALAAGPLQAQQPPSETGPQFGAGLGMIYSANAIADASDTLIVVPFFFYEAPNWYVRGPLAGYRAYQNQRVRIGLNARVDFQSWKPDDSPALAGMERREMTVEFGASASYRFNPVILNLSVWQDAFDRHGGWESSVSLAYPHRLSDQLMLISRIEGTLLSGSKANYHYGIRPGESAPGRPVYRPGRSYTGGIGLSGNYRFNEDWLGQMDLALTFLSSDLRNSPIVDKRVLPRVILGVVRLF
ncbi:MAG: MipA/OmpV family protein [Opitutales bacterium]|nr:MipA/OmpV family protein [Opitutales bacterium]